MFGPYQATGPEPIGFLLFPRFPMIALFSAVEPLRVANRFGGDLFSWHVYSVDGNPVTASNGMTLMVESSIEAVDFIPTLFVCSSFCPQQYITKKLLLWLRCLNTKGITLGALDTGAYFLAKAGLLDGYRITMHWEAVPGFCEEFSHIQVTDELFEVDQNRVTCAGGTAAMDMMLQMIAQKHGSELAIAVSEQFIRDRIRDRRDRQRMQLGARLGVYHPKLLKIIQIMEENLEEPLQLEQLVSLAGVSRRQLERLCDTLLHNSPQGYYRKLRLERAQKLLQQTSMHIADVAAACGFNSPSSFSHTYASHFGYSPKAER